MSENDADKRPQINAHAEGSAGKINIQLRGAEGETSEDVAAMLPDALEQIDYIQRRLDDDDDREVGVE